MATLNKMITQLPTFKIKRDYFLLVVSKKEDLLTPMSSTSILSKPTGPSELFTILAIEAAAVTVSTKQIVFFISRIVS